MSTPFPIKTLEAQVRNQQSMIFGLTAALWRVLTDLNGAGKPYTIERADVDAAQRGELILNVSVLDGVDRAGDLIAFTPVNPEVEAK